MENRNKFGFRKNLNYICKLNLNQLLWNLVKY